MDNIQRKLLKAISEAQFAFYECSMFLDTHPDCSEALAQREKFRKRYETLINQYEREFGPITLSADFGNDGFNWVNDPWPWEKEAN